MSGWDVLGDWGSTRLRLWRTRDGQILDRRDGPGIGALSKPPIVALRDAMAPWLALGMPDRVSLSGMAGARGALYETGYLDCPLSASGWKRAAATTQVTGLRIRVAAGCANGRDDVMRGEETQVFGALALYPELASARQLVVLPGTHCKWAWLEDGAIVSFRTMLTGELFALLKSSSLLSLDSRRATDLDEDGFAAGIAHAQTSPGVIGKLFTARAAQLRRGQSPAWAESYLSGLLIAGEIAEMQSTFALPEYVSLIGESGLTRLYAPVLASFGIRSQVLDGEKCALAGLRVLDEDD